MSLLMDFVMHVLVDMVVVALPLSTADMLGDPHDWSGLCDGDDDLNLIHHHVG